ncbi:hypothetical protein [Fulvivirga ligni]|uniref:hypothetical protein n=1 Tax=Fulvivirga ligni TaxID=2904246 RepID=UPI001F2FCFAA|nr:hypothetical protein [Fulvivirga ligni]UII22315.1 hypothetical protein LVD16_03610 [Fulvivirga ligni]
MPSNKLFSTLINFHEKLVSFQHKLIKGNAISFIILIGLSIAMAYQSAHLSRQFDTNRQNFQTLTYGMESYKDSIKVAWQPRIFSNYLSTELSEATASLTGKSLTSEKNVALTVGTWTVFWFVLIGLTYIYLFGRQSIFYIIGTFAAMVFGYVPQLLRIYPWDMPIVLGFVLFMALLFKKKYNWMLLLLPLAMGFKETALVLCLGFLLIDQPWKMRVKYFLISGVLSVTVKVIIDIMLGTPLPFFTMEHAHLVDNKPQGLYLFYNIKIFLYQFSMPLFVNGGMLLAFILIPSFSREAKIMKVISYAFIASILLFGIILEYRIFFELIPFCLYYLSQFMNAKTNHVEEEDYPEIEIEKPEKSSKTYEEMAELMA